tara:strand:+ start:152 stop:1099 length:948 start_codon:yes stop_codon:yes gene_type:complete
MGKIVVKNIQSQNSTTAFKLPVTDGAAGQVMNTDGSGNLGWGSQETFKSADGSSLTYTLPNTDGSSGQFLQSNSTGGDTKWGTVASPTSTPDGTEQGWQFLEKVVFDESVTGNTAEINLSVPTAITTTPSDVLALRLDFWSVSGMAMSNQAYPAIRNYDQAGTTTAGQVNLQNYGISYFSSYGRNTNSGSYSYTAGSGFYPDTQYFGGACDFTSSGQKLSYNSTGYRGAGICGSYIYWNARGYPFGTMMSWGSAHSVDWSQYDGYNFGVVYNNQTTPFATVGVTHTMTFKVHLTNGSNINNGTFVLSGWFKDGVV